MCLVFCLEWLKWTSCSATLECLTILSLSIWLRLKPFDMELFGSGSGAAYTMTMGRPANDTPPKSILTAAIRQLQSPLLLPVYIDYRALWLWLLDEMSVWVSQRQRPSWVANLSDTSADDFHYPHQHRQQEHPIIAHLIYQHNNNNEFNNDNYDNNYDCCCCNNHHNCKWTLISSVINEPSRNRAQIWLMNLCDKIDLS